MQYKIVQQIPALLRIIQPKIKILIDTYFSKRSTKVQGQVQGEGILGAKPPPLCCHS